MSQVQAGLRASNSAESSLLRPDSEQSPLPHGKPQKHAPTAVVTAPAGVLDRLCACPLSSDGRHEGAAEQEPTRCAASHPPTPPATGCHTSTACCALCPRRPLSGRQGPCPACTVHSGAMSRHVAQQLPTRQAASPSCLHRRPCWASEAGSARQRRGSVSTMQQPSECQAGS